MCWYRGARQWLTILGDRERVPHVVTHPPKEIAAPKDQEIQSDLLPVMVLGRLAVDHNALGLKLAGALLKDAVNRAVRVSQNVGVRALLVRALHDGASASTGTTVFRRHRFIR